MAMVTVGSERVEVPSPPISAPSKIKTYAFAIVIILGVCGVIVGVVGVGGFALNTMSRATTIPLMSIGGGGFALWIIGMVGVHQTKFMDPNTPGVYGAEKWLEIWGVKVLDRVPPPPHVDLSQGDKILFYIPQVIEFERERQQLSIANFQKISAKKNSGNNLFWARYRNLQGDVTTITRDINNRIATPGWILIDKNVRQELIGKNEEEQAEIIGAQRGKIAHALEVILLFLTLRYDTHEQLDNINTFIECSEKVGRSPVVVIRDDKRMLAVYNNDMPREKIGYVYAPLWVQRQF